MDTGLQKIKNGSKETFEKAVNVVQVIDAGGLDQGVAMKRIGLFSGIFRMWQQ